MPIKSDFPPVEVATDPLSKTLFNSLWRHFSETPHRPALIHAQNEEERVTYGELYVYGHAVAAFLNSKGFGYRDMACLVLPNCWQFLTIFGGAILQGGAISGLNQQSTQYEIQKQVVDSKSKVVFCSDVNLKCVLAAVEKCPLVEVVVVIETSNQLHMEEHKRSKMPVIPFAKVLRTEPVTGSKKCNVVVDKDILILPYSSGTTGASKGVMVSHKNFGSMMNMLTRPFYFAKENQMLMLPFYHIYGFGMLINCLLNGSTGIILEKFDHQIFCESIQKYRFRMLMIVPPVLVWMSKSKSVHRYDLSSVELLFSGAAPAGRDLCVRLRKKFPTIKHIAQGYGMTELSLGSNFPVLDKERFEASGKLLSNMEMKILDVENGLEVDRGMPGEIHLRGPTVMMGYLGNPKATAETIDPEGWLKTGDIGYLDKEGFLYIVDRLKELIKVKGFQVAPAELEDLLLSHPDIKDCAVIGIPDRFSGELPLAYVVKGKASLTEADVANFVKEKVAYYKHLKGGVVFMDEIPKSPSGKILRRFLRDQHKQSLQSKI